MTPPPVSRLTSPAQSGKVAVLMGGCARLSEQSSGLFARRTPGHGWPGWGSFEVCRCAMDGLTEARP
jgi:hypothetical protein